MEDKYTVKRINYKTNELICDYGIMTIEEIRSFAKKFIENPFNPQEDFIFWDEKAIEKDIKFILENGNEEWDFSNFEVIRIDKIEKGE